VRLQLRVRRRIVFLWTGDLITLLDLGSHDEVY
jgi:hypothetical protein